MSPSQLINTLSTGPDVSVFINERPGNVSFNRMGMGSPSERSLRRPTRGSSTLGNQPCGTITDSVERTPQWLLEPPVPIKTRNWERADRSDNEEVFKHINVEHNQGMEARRSPRTWSHWGTTCSRPILNRLWTTRRQGPPIHKDQCPTNTNSLVQLQMVCLGPFQDYRDIEFLFS